MSTPAKPPPLLLDRRYWPMFWTQFSGAFNDNFFKNALGILVVYSGATAFGLEPEQFVPLTAAVFMLPYFLFSATAGQLADKYEKSRLIRIIKLAEIAIMGLGLVGFLAHQYELLVGVLFLMGAQSAFFGPVKYGILPQLVDEDRLVGGNALVELATYVAILGGTIGGGLLITWERDGQPLGLWLVCGGIVAIALVGWVFSRQIVTCPAEAPDLVVQWDPVRPTWNILKLTLQNRVVLLSVLGITWFWSFGTAFLSLFLPYAKGVLGGDEHVATMFLAAFSIGIAIGSIVCERLSKHRLELGLVPIGAFGMSLFCADLFLVGQPWVADPSHLIGLREFFAHGAGWRIQADLLLIASFGGMYIVPLYTLVQQRTDDAIRSRVIAGNNIINALFMVLMSLALIVVQGMGFTPPQIFGMLAVLNAIATWFVFWQVPEFLIRFVIWMLSNVFYRVKVVGMERLPKEGPCVIAPNHVSFVDWFILSGAIKRPVHFVMDVSFANLPIMKWFTRNDWVIPIASPKRDEVAYEQAFVTIRRKLREGWIVGLFPEGEITHDGALNPFKKGIEKVVERDAVPVVPVAIRGMWGSWFSRKDGSAMKKAPRRFWSRVTIVIGEPIPPADVSAERLQSEVRALLEAPAV